MAERGMGRGLAAILPGTKESDSELRDLPLDLIQPNPDQPRSELSEPALEELASSVAERGVLQPVLVRPLYGGRYELIVGERRWRAARRAGLERIPAIVRRDVDGPSLELALIENMARQDLNPVDEARACAALVEELGLSKQDVARRVGRSRAAVSNLIRLLDLPIDVLVLVEAGSLSEGHGRAILQVRDPERRRALAREAAQEGLSVREVERRARGEDGAPAPGVLGKSAPGFKPHPDQLEVARQAEDALEAALGVEVTVKLSASGGHLEIPFEDVRELFALAERAGRSIAA